MTTNPITRIEVHRRGPHVRAGLRGGHLSARRLPDEGGRVRVALVATVALLLAGDNVRIEVVVGPGVDLEIIETAGTVAYDMRGGHARWDVDIAVGEGGLLSWEGQPFIAAGGSRVHRSCRATLDAGIAVLRETYVLGRTGEEGGELHTSMRASLDGRPLLAEDLDLGPSWRPDPAVLAGARCMDVVTTLGTRDGGVGALQLAGTGSIHRRMVRDLHHSDLASVFHDATAGKRRRNTALLGSGEYPKGVPAGQELPSR